MTWKKEKRGKRNLIKTVLKSLESLRKVSREVKENTKDKRRVGKFTENGKTQTTVRKLKFTKKPENLHKNVIKTDSTSPRKR
jgi:hypothetical protein